jgi:hypothetical protein
MTDMPDPNSFEEPTIVINGRTLTYSEAMAVRVAVTEFHTEMGKDDALGDDESGRSMAAGYRRNLDNTLRFMNVISES